MQKIAYRRDAGLWLFGLLSLAALIVSVPATLAVVSWFHVDGTDAGLFMTYAMIGLFELAAVACIVAPLWVIDAKTDGIANGLLLLTTGANFLHGLQVFSGQQNLPEAALYVQQTPALLWIACALYAGIVPLLLKTFLSKFVKRVQYLRHDANDVQLQVQRMIDPVQQLLAGAAQLAASMQQLQLAEQPTLQVAAPLQLPVAAPVQTYARVAEPVQPMVQGAEQAPQGVPTTRLPAIDDTIEVDLNDYSSVLKAASKVVNPYFTFNDRQYTCCKCQSVNDVPAGSDGKKLRQSSGRYGCPKCKT